jgi:uncharacterized protein YdhG (YjbR/CyaY superfamily)
MQSKATNVDAYLEALDDDRKKAITQLRKVIKQNLPKGFEEQMGYGMIGYVVPHSIYPAGYHCNPKLPLPFINIASQKNGIVMHHMGLYANTELLNWFTETHTKASTKKLDMGKGCVRFKKLEDIPYKLIGELVGKITVADWIAQMEAFAKK